MFYKILFKLGKFKIGNIKYFIGHCGDALNERLNLLKRYFIKIGLYFQYKIILFIQI